MTPQNKRQVAVGVVTTVLGALVLALLSAAQKSVVPRAEYDLHVQREAYAHQRAALQDSLQSELLRDVLCSEAIRPTDRRCR